MNKMDILKLNNERVNKIYSPYSLLVALSMLNEGASGATREELNRILNYERIHNIDNIDYILSTINKMYVKRSDNSSINVFYKNIIKEKYNADLELDDLNDVTIINKYVEEKTFGQIKNMLNNLDGFLLLINILAIDMEWPYEIRAEKVSSGLFNNDYVSFIHGFDKSIASYYKDDETTVLGLDLKKYDNNNYECILIQPDNIELSEYINAIDDNKINYLLNNIKPLKDDEREVSISVPKFSFDYELPASKTFESLGLNLRSPNLSGITSIHGIVKIHHKANIDFSEKGLKAAAATIVEISRNAAFSQMGEKLEIKIDKPFLFALVEKESNTILFLGTVYNPILWEEDSKNYTHN